VSAFVINPYQFSVPFVPTDISGLFAWYDASDANTLYDNTTGGSQVAADGEIKRWEDKTANGYHLTQATSTRFPIRKTAVQNGKDVVRFDGSNDFIARVNTPNESQPTSIFAVCKTTRFNQTSGSREYVIDSYLAGDARQIIAARGNQTNQPSRFGGTAWVSSGVSTPSGFFLAGGIYDGSSSKAIVNSTVGSAGNAGSFAIRGVALGVNFTANGDFLNGDIAEVLLYDSALSGADITKVYNYLAANWGL
jgi:Neuraminidase (sialidase)